MNRVYSTGYCIIIIAFLFGLVCTGSGLAFAQEASGSAGDSLMIDTAPYTSELALFLRFIFALAIVLFLLILTLWVLKRFSRFRKTGLADSAIDVLSIRYIERNKAVALVRVVDRVLIIGISENALTTLGELSPEELNAVTIDATTEPWVFGNLLARFTGKRSDREQSS